MSAQPDNLARLHAALDARDLDAETCRSVCNHLLGGVADDVDPARWDAAVQRAITFTLGSRAR